MIAGLLSAGAFASGEASDALSGEQSASTEASTETTDAASDEQASGEAASGEASGEQASGEEASDEASGEQASGEEASAEASGEQAASGEASDGASGEQSASGEAGGASGGPAVSADSTDTEVITLVPETVDELIIGAQAYEFTTDMNVGHLEVDPTALITAPYPVIVFFNESSSVENGTVIGNVQFVSDYDEAIAIVHTNDVHGHLDVEPYVKGLADELKASGKYSLVLTVSAGDVYGGGEAVGSAYRGEMIPAVVDRIYDFIAPGNNDYTISGYSTQNILLTRLYEHTQTLCANIQTMETGLPLAEYAANYEPKVGVEMFDALYEKVKTAPDGSLDLSALGLMDLPGGVAPYAHTATVTTDKGTVVGLFGLTTYGGAPAKETDCLASIPQSQLSVDSLRAEGADIVVCLGHTGWLGENATGGSVNDTNSWQVASQVTGIDVFVDGHTHSIINKGQGVFAGTSHTYINQAQSFGYCIGQMILYLKDGKLLAVQGDVFTDLSFITPDAEIQALVDAELAKVKEDFGKPIAHTDYFLNAERMSAGNEGGTARGNETNLGDLMTDIILASASEKMGVDYDFCCYPGYWLRASIEAGDITLESIQGIFANPTVLYYDTYTGEQVLSMVQRGLGSVYPEKENTTFNQYSGLRVAYTDQDGTGTPVSIWIGDTLIYDAGKGGLQVGPDWTCTGVLTMTGGEIDSYTGDGANFICDDNTAVQEMVGSWLQSHGPEYYTIYPNTIAPDSRIVAVN